MTTEALMKRCQIGVPRGPNAYDQLHSILAECYGTLGAQATEIDRLQAEVAGLREELAQKVVDQTMLTGLTVQDGGLTMGLQGGAAGLLAEMLTQQFKDGGGINYLQLSFTSSVALPGEAFIVTVQKCAGKTPHQLRMDAETEAAALRAEVAGMREALTRLRKWGDMGAGYNAAVAMQVRDWIDAGMTGDLPAMPEWAVDREAAVAARKGEA